MTATSLRIPIYGLGCGGGGARAVERALVRSPGVIHIYVNPATETAQVEVDPALTDAGRLTLVIEQTGYRAGPAREA
jgi:copper chaperone CopZ